MQGLSSNPDHTKKTKIKAQQGDIDNNLEGTICMWKLNKLAQSTKINIVIV